MFLDPEQSEIFPSLVLNQNNDSDISALSFGCNAKECDVSSNGVRLGARATMEECQSSNASGNADLDHATIPRIAASLSAKLAVSRALASQKTSF